MPQFRYPCHVSSPQNLDDTKLRSNVDLNHFDSRPIVLAKHIPFVHNVMNSRWFESPAHNNCRLPCTLCATCHQVNCSWLGSIHAIDVLPYQVVLRFLRNSHKA